MDETSHAHHTLTGISYRELPVKQKLVVDGALLIALALALLFGGGGGGKQPPRRYS